MSWLKSLTKSKTFWTGVGGLLVAVGSYLSGEMGSSEALNLGVISLSAIFLRDAVRKASPQE